MGFVPFTFVDLIDIILVAVIMYWIYRMTKGTNAPYILSGIIAVYLLWVVVRALNMELLSTILGHIISVGAISGYFTSEIGRRMLQSGNVRREWAFNLRLTGQQALLLQGVIDCAFEENGAWVLVDYKTDRVDDEQTLVNRYAEQLAWYARALTEITGKPVKERYLYALRVGKAIAVPEIDAK